MAEDNKWAQLVSTTDIESDHIQIVKNKLTIGRNRGNDVCLVENPFVSGTHCFIEKDVETGIVWLHDTSTNGTLVNGIEKLIHQKTRLKHGDEIHIVGRKADTTHNVAYIFQDMDELRREESLMSDSSDLNCTQPYSETLEDCSLYRSLPKRELSVDLTSPDPKRHSDSSLVPASKDGGRTTGELASGEHASLSFAPRLFYARTSTRAGSVIDTAGVSTSAQPPVSLAASSSQPEGSSSSGSREMSSSEGTRNLSSAELVTQSLEPTQTQSSEPPTSVASSQDSSRAASSGQPGTSSADEIEESLQCVICQEILYKCVSTQPCMHSFCAGCYSEWMQVSSDCPSCRVKVERISRNHLVNNLVEAYLKANPGKRRPEAELKDLDAKNKITEEMLTVRSKRRHDDDDTSDDSDSGDYNDSSLDNSDLLVSYGDDSESDYDDNDSDVSPPNKTVCRQCPEYVGCTSFTPAGAAAVQRPTPPPYVCSASQTHIMCLCCSKPMPDRRRDHAVPSQSCAICHRFYCHMYWGCLRAGCDGCLAKFNEFAVSRETLSRLVLDNEFESDILKQYLESHQMSVGDLLAECCRQLAAGSYTCPDEHSLAGGSAAVCAMCFRRNFSELVYQYRRDIPRHKLPAAALNRTDCYWGRQCRTQRCKLAHARNFSHICEQTRMS